MSRQSARKERAGYYATGAVALLAVGLIALANGVFTAGGFALVGAALGAVLARWYSSR